MPELINNLLALATSVAGKLVGAIIALIVGKIIIKAVMKSVKKSKLMKNSEPTVARFASNFIKIALNVLLVIIVIGILGVPMASVITVVASAGVAVGLALQGSLSNLAGGIMILIFRPFKIDNFVDIAGSAGTVADIGIFYTVLKTPDNKEITIPNGTVMASTITNYSVHETRRLDFTLSVAYGTDVEKVKAVLLDEAAKNEMVLKDPAPFARLSNHGESSLEYTLRVWSKASDYWTVKFDLLENVKKEFDANGISIPYPQMDVHIDNIKK